MSADQDSSPMLALQRILIAYDAYRARGVSPAPNEYSNLVYAIECARGAEEATHFAFLIKRERDTLPWATIFEDRARAEAYPDRVSDVVPVRLVSRLTSSPAAS